MSNKLQQLKTELPQRIVVTRTFTYLPHEMIEDSPEMYDSIESVYDVIEEWVDNDFRSPISRHEMVWTETYEDGTEVER